jgi:CARDB
MDNPSGPSLSGLSFLAGFGFGAFVGGALALLAVALLKDDNTPVVVYDQPQATATVEPTGTPAAVAEANLPTARLSLDVRIGPGTGYAVVGLLGRGDEVEPVGRSADLDWVAIRFPPGSAALGWVPVSGLDGVTGLSSLSVLLPTPLPRTVPDFPTPSASVTGTPAEGTTTPGAGGTPDLVVTSLSVLADGRFSAVVTNQGDGELKGFAIFVQFRDLASKSELVREEADLAPGESITIRSSAFRLTQDAQIQAIVDPTSSIAESDETNNVLQRLLQLPKTPTVTPTP